MTPRYRWLAANYDLWAGRSDEPKRQLRRLLEMVQMARAEEAEEFSHYIQPTFRLALSAFNEPQVVFREVLPSGRDAGLKLDYVYYLAVHGQAEAAYRIWGRVVADAGSFPFALARPYVDYLLNSGRYQEGARVWGDLERLGAVAKPAPGDQDNLVFNGSFEEPPLNSGLDWRHKDLRYPPISFSDPQAYQGNRCLRVDFNARMNDGYEPVYEYVPVIPDRMYVLTGYTRSRNITSDSGPRLRVLDPAHPNQLDTATEPTLGTTGWHPVSLTFRAPAQTSLVQVSVWRQRSVTFPPEVTGTFWVDAVSLKAAPPRPGGEG